MIYITALSLRLLALAIIVLGVLPTQIEELRIEKNGLRKLKLYLFLFTISLCILNIAAITLLLDLTLDSKTLLSNIVIILNGVGYFVGSFLLYRIYHRKF